MGQEQSSLIDEDVQPRSLCDRTLESIAKYIKDGRAKKIVVMVGAGISTSAGIPDFRSPDTGLYANLARLELPYAEAVFDISYFRSNPLPFYTLARELYPGSYKPTISHSFIRLLSQKGLLLKLFTQNIDCLDRAAGVPAEDIVEAHGSFSSQHCIDCGMHFPDEEMAMAVSGGRVPHCKVVTCGGLVKPDIVFFGESLPASFHENTSLPAAADLCLVIGTSLSVQPFASLPSFCAEGVPRLLINLERVGGLGSRPDDVVLLGPCDTGIRKLAKALGWDEELESLCKETRAVEVDRLETPPELVITGDHTLESQINQLADDVEGTLKISQRNADQLRHYLEEDELNGSLGQSKKINPPEVSSASLSNGPVPSKDSVNEGPSSRSTATLQRDLPGGVKPHSTKQDAGESCLEEVSTASI